MTRWTTKQLEQLNTAPKKKQLKPPMTKTNPLTKQALSVLDFMGFKVWRQNNGGVYDPKLKKFRANSSTPGISDIIGFHKQTGRFIACEIKAGKDRLSSDQELFLKSVEDSGGVALVIRTTDDLEILVKKNL